MRLVFFKYFLAAMLIVLVIGLFYTQILQGDYYKDLSENNRIRLIPLAAPRGHILDRSGRMLAGNRPSYTIYLMPRDFDRSMSGWLEKTLDLPAGSIEEKLNSKKYRPYLPLELKQDVSREIVFQVEEKKPDLTGVFLTIEGRRYYPFGEEAAQITGYLGKVTEGEYASGEGEYTINDVIGRSGIEKTQDSVLRGENGGRQVEVNSRGQLIRVLGERKPVPGHDVTLSIDLDVQHIVWDEVKDHPNNLSVGILDVGTGGMVAMVSKPSYDPNIFVSGGSSKERLEILKDKRYPMMNRFLSVGYPPGSVFKLVTALAGLEAKKIRPETSFTCSGTFRIGSSAHVFHCWTDYGHGTLDLHQAITQSCNVYFYNVGRLTGEENLARTAKLLGLSSPPAIEVPLVFGGLIPDGAWKQARFKERWYQGETISYAIGQGYVLVSPLQVLRLVASYGLHGLLPKISIIKGTPPAAEKIPVDSKNIETIRNAMRDVVQNVRGTGKFARVPFMEIGAKTGTAQNPRGKSHAWFAGFFPYDRPRYAMAVMIEHGGAGGLAAGTLAKEILMRWHDEKGETFV